MDDFNSLFTEVQRDCPDSLPVENNAGIFVFPIYSQLSPCGHLAITDTPKIRTAAEFPTKIYYRRLTEINSRHHGPSLLRTD